MPAVFSRRWPINHNGTCKASWTRKKAAGGLVEPTSLSLDGGPVDADQREVQVPKPRKNPVQGRLIDHGASEHGHLTVLPEGKPVEPLPPAASQVSPEPYLVELSLQMRPPALQGRSPASRERPGGR